MFLWVFQYRSKLNIETPLLLKMIDLPFTPCRPRVLELALSHAQYALVQLFWIFRAMHTMNISSGIRQWKAESTDD